MKFQRLKLVAVNDKIKRDLREKRDEFSATHQIELPDNWPKFPEAFENDIIENPPFCGYLFIEDKSDRLIGNGGIVAPPDENGMVEIGYEIAPFYQGQGFATEAANAIISIAFENGASTIIAHTESIANASNAVLKKIGFKFSKELPCEELGKIWQWKMEKTA